jgi:signal transduction histidine kinase
MFKLLRYYAVASFIAILATVVLLTWFYRQVAIEGIVQLVERNNLTLARTAMSSMNPALLSFLDTTADFHPGNPIHRQLPPELAESIKMLMRSQSIVRIKIYNRQGMVVFSTKPSQIGTDLHDNAGFIAAINGDVNNTLIYRDTFNSFDRATEEDNLMQSYLPVRHSPVDPIRGVFEIYTDVNNLVHQTERTEFIILAGAILILSALYAALILIVRHANEIIEQQQHTILERTETLKSLSAQMLTREETHKQRIAVELHEGLAQTLSAVKLKVEKVRAHKASDEDDKSVDSIIPVLQQAIQEVRTIATNLRPSSLDDIGLLPTIKRLCSEFEERHPDTHIERQISLQEQDIPPPLKIIIYRIIVSVLADMENQPSIRRIHLALWLEDDNLVLMMDDTTTDALDSTAIPLANIDPQLRTGFAGMEELTTLSGGVFTASHHARGGATLRAAWSQLVPFKSKRISDAR